MRTPNAADRDVRRQRHTEVLKVKITGSFMAMDAESRMTRKTTTQSGQMSQAGNNNIHANWTTNVVEESYASSASLVAGNGETLSNLARTEVPETQQLQGDTLELSEDAANAAARFGALRGGDRTDAPVSTQKTGGYGVELSSKQKMQLSIIQVLFESCTGRKMKFYGPLAGTEENCGQSTQALHDFYKSLAPGGDTAQNVPVNGAQRLVTTWTDTTFEEEQYISFSVAGSVTTADGKTIDLNIDLKMGSSFYEQHTEVAQEMQRMCDPLVLNFEGGAAELTGEKFSFDLDCDGTAENISFVGAGSGLLALDKNGDGAVNDGSELFGTISGNGFGDLAAYDDDGNGWIDENDAIYENLRIWSRDENGDDTLLALGVRGVGAIYLGNVATDFTVRGDDGAVNGAIRRSGVFLTEAGDVGTVQHVDFSV